MIAAKKCKVCFDGINRKDTGKKLDIPTRRGTVLDGVLFRAEAADTVLIAITGIHGNFYSNPFYYNIGETLTNGGMDFIYAQTNDAFGKTGLYFWSAQGIPISKKSRNWPIDFTS